MKKAFIWILILAMVIPYWVGGAHAEDAVLSDEMLEYIFTPEHYDEFNHSEFFDGLANIFDEDPEVEEIHKTPKQENLREIVKQFRDAGFSEIGFMAVYDNDLRFGKKDDVLLLRFELEGLNWTMAAMHSSPEEIEYPVTAFLADEGELKFQHNIGQTADYWWMIEIDEPRFNVVFSVYFPKRNNLYLFYSNEVISSETEFNIMQFPTALLSMPWNDVDVDRYIFS